MTRTSFVFALSLTMLAASSALAAAPRLVVNASNGTPSITKAKVADIFLKRVTRWDNGHSITPVDLSEKSPARSAFSREILGKEVAWVKSYWQKMIFSGRATPPVELASESEVLELIHNNPDAIGYVSDGVALPAGVKALPVSE